jgi:signal transduction histidine kinase/CheY-like chemotaxis protein
VNEANQGASCCEGEGSLGEESAHARLLEQIAVAANSSATSDAALQTCLDLVCKHVGWPVGHVYRRAEDSGPELISTTLWHLDDPVRFAVFREVTERTPFASGIGLPGRVLASGEPTWIPDVTQDANFPRAQLAVDIGVRAAFGFPILVGSEIAAVLEFFATHSIPPNARLLEVMGHVGTQLGRAVERERAARALHASQQRYESIFERVPVGIWEEDLSEVLAALGALKLQGVTDLRRHFAEQPGFLRQAAGMVKVLDVNQAALRMSGIPHKRFVLGTLDRLFEGQPLDLLREELIAIFEGKTFFESESRNRTLQGERLDTQVSLVIPSEQSAFSNMIVCTVDVTDRNRAQEERAALAVRMREAQRLESLGLLAGGLAHDFNNLLAVILGNSRLVLESLPPESSLASKLREIRSAAGHAADLTDQMLIAAGKRSPVRASVDLAALVDGLLDLCRSSLPANATLRTELARDVPPVEGDAVQLRQVVLNLVTNAGEALAGEPGSVSLRVSRARFEAGDLTNAIGAPDLGSGEYACLEVSDTGAGIDAEIQARLFEPFFTTKFTGRGLGLAAVLGIVRSHHGGIQLESHPGAGARFRVLLPRQADGTRSARVPSEHAAAEIGTGHILVIDDDEPILRLMQVFLEEAGFEVTTVLGGRAGVEVVRRTPERFDGVVLDLVMPDIDGTRVFEEIRRIRPDLAVVLVSGYAEEAARNLLGVGSRVSFLHKPFEPEQLIERLRAAFASKQA